MESLVKSSFVYFLTLFCLAQTAKTFAVETDNTTQRYDVLADSGTIADAFVKKGISQAIEKLNEEGLGCNRPALYQAMKKIFIPPFYGSTLEFYMVFSDHVPKLSMSGIKNIYNSFESSTEELLAIGSEPGLYTPVSIANNVRVYGKFIGTDKLGHFFSISYNYFTRAYDLKTGAEIPGNLKNALEYGEWTENWIYGRLVSGIYSYADLATNYAGLQFWKNLLDGESPHLKCQDDHFVEAHPFTFKDYVSHAWDEGINCSQSHSPIQEIMERTERELTISRKKRYICPASRSICSDLVAKTPVHLQAHLLSPECRSAAAWFDARKAAGLKTYD